MKKKYNFIFLVGFLLIIPSLNAQNALNFDGSNDFVQTSYKGIAGSTARTVQAQIKTTVNTDPNNSGTKQIILDWGSATATGGRFTLCMRQNNAIRLEIGGSDLSGNIAINDSLWHNVAVVYNPSSTTYNTTLYVDGIKDTVGNVSSSLNTTISTYFRMGKGVDGHSSFNGSLDEVRVWDTVLTQSQIQANMNTEICSPPSSLVAYYKFNQGTAGGNNSGKDTLFSAINSAHNGSLINFSLSGSSSNWVSDTSVSNISYDSLSINACTQYTSPSGNYTWTTTGTYQDTISNATGCDSIISINLNISSIDSTVSQNLNVLAATETGAKYQWVDCNNGYALIAGDTNRTFIATGNGSYAVIITKLPCIDTSACTTIIGVGMNELQLYNNTQIAPNPTNGQITVQLSANFKAKKVTVRNIIGKVVNTKNLNSSSNFNLNIQGEGGVYFIEIESIDGQKTNLKVIKK